MSDTNLPIDEIVGELSEPTSPSPFLYLFVVIIVALGFFAWGNEFHVVDRQFGFGPVSFLLSLATAVALFSYMVRRDGMPSMRESVGVLYGRGSALGFSIVVFFIIPFMLCMGGFPGVARVANCLFDTSTPEVRTVRRLQSVQAGSKVEAGKRSWLYVMDGTEKKWVPIPRKQFAELKDSKFVKLTTRSGAIGGEWVTGVEAE